MIHQKQILKIKVDSHHRVVQVILHPLVHRIVAHQTVAIVKQVRVVKCIYRHNNDNNNY